MQSGHTGRDPNLRQKYGKMNVLTGQLEQKYFFMQLILHPVCKSLNALASAYSAETLPEL